MHRETDQRRAWIHDVGIQESRELSRFEHEICVVRECRVRWRELEEVVGRLAVEIVLLPREHLLGHEHVQMKDSLPMALGLDLVVVQQRTGHTEELAHDLEELLLSFATSRALLGL